ncbi:helix-turn-helix domain-containing protein [Leptospira kmetyi]|uniref:HTH cro/C1-type domain-containing protein n=1 Tax=Leptospira kmetyi TaxID=408139 RepID=A0ABX4N5V5_9LEPT|nr:helix-turn-helix transcriptional regulator [Leptospira kmetyi]PJZ28774.1 hypothetical protein CH378_16390 [Leptospira kmetyi]PJZ39521.1 hypothetical protein CH370_20925 [Leptospira kmetyi]
MKKSEFDLSSSGGRVKYVRLTAKKQPLSQGAFADSLYVSQSLLSKIESNETEVTDQTLALIEFIYFYSKLWVSKGLGPEKIDPKKELLIAKRKLDEIEDRDLKIEKLPNAKETIDLYLGLPKKQRGFIDNFVLRIYKKWANK